MFHGGSVGPCCLSEQPVVPAVSAWSTVVAGIFFLAGGTVVYRSRSPDAPRQELVIALPPLTLADKTRRMYSLLTSADYTDGSMAGRLADAIRQYLQRLAGEIGDLDGYEQTEEYGSFWHTANDDLADATSISSPCASVVVAHVLLTRILGVGGVLLTSALSTYSPLLAGTPGASEGRAST